MKNKEPQESFRPLYPIFLKDIINQVDDVNLVSWKDELVQERLISVIQNDHIREKMPSKNDLTLTKAIQL